MLPFLVAGFAFGVGAAVGEEVANTYIIPAAIDFYDSCCEVWDELVPEVTPEAEAE